MAIGKLPSAVHDEAAEHMAAGHSKPVAYAKALAAHMNREFPNDAIEDPEGPTADDDLDGDEVPCPDCGAMLKEGKCSKCGFDESGDGEQDRALEGKHDANPSGATETYGEAMKAGKVWRGGF